MPRRSPAEALTEVPPHDLAVERALLGAVMTGRDPLPPLLAEEFYAQRHRLLWSVIQELHAFDGRAPAEVVSAVLRRRGQLEEAGGPAHLALCVEEGCTLYPLTGAARIIRDLARERAMLHLGADLLAQGLSRPEVEARLAAMPGPVAQAIWAPADAWARIRARWGEARIETGWAPLDEVTGGFAPGELVVIGGRTSHGKTSFACAAALRLAAGGIPVDILTLEDPVEAITRRLVATLTGIGVRRLGTGQIAPSEEEAAQRAIADLARLPLTVTGIDRHAQATEEGVLGLLAACRGQVIILDHLQRVQTKDPSRAYALERVLGRIHGHAQRAGQVAWVNCQLNREVEVRKDGRPTLADLRDSGSIEILARQIWLLSWPVRWDPKRDWRDYLVDVAKNSEGPVRKVAFRWEPSCGRFWTEADPDGGGDDGVPAWVTSEDTAA